MIESVIESVVVCADPATRDPVEVLVVLGGEIDMGTIADLPDQTRALLAPVPTTVVLDARAVTFIDGFALGVLCTLQRQLRAGGHDLLLCSPSPQVRWVLSLTHLAHQLAPGAA